MPDDLTEPYVADDTTTYDGMDVDGSDSGGYEPLPDDTTTYDGMDVDGSDDSSELEGYEQPSDTTTY
ncbi:hypothetical protein [Stackebrandtia nassauensis]|uniref:Uncharacterized protein n=1 Tax=Stackebrandtia nassauensis (strain DSM 44728 / CIP 108903 / NRRL B-16338 / NBRC 102104 / LLR-40K-21) TaxID=446470 RepID=D3Q4V3_STANL|nr:hypothetical protein [Stackebrandtia nassauensis]ADD42133.1 hypothetical protein Snas_2450 [Stackebrandtia nassauensis DSM 44728]